MVITATELKKRFGETTSRVEYAGERIVVRRNGREAFALIPIDDLRLLEAIEDKIDVLAAKESLDDPAPVRPLGKGPERAGLIIGILN